MGRWTRHPAVRSEGELTRGERAADVLRNAMGSWGFVFAALAFLAVWMLLNFLAIIHHWDPYPFILLNLVLSCVAALQGAVLLIAAKRADQISSELAHHDFDVNQEALEGIRTILERVVDRGCSGTCGCAGTCGGSGGMSPPSGGSEAVRPPQGS